MKSKPIIVDSSIYRNSEPKGFTPTGYKINVCHPIIKQLYERFKRKHNLPAHYPPSDNERFNFERIIFRMIEAGKIVVKDDLQKRA